MFLACNRPAISTFTQWPRQALAIAKFEPGIDDVVEAYASDAARISARYV
jgi:hypothetical protein